MDPQRNTAFYTSNTGGNSCRAHGNMRLCFVLLTPRDVRTPSLKSPTGCLLYKIKILYTVNQNKEENTLRNKVAN